MIDEHVRENMRKVLADIREGTFAQEWIAEMDDGRAAPRRAAREGGEERIEEVGARAARADATEQPTGERMASVDVPVALLGYGTVGAAVNRLLRENADDIERATGHRLRVVRALVRDPDKERGVRARRRAS